MSNETEQTSSVSVPVTYTQSQVQTILRNAFKRKHRESQQIHQEFERRLQVRHAEQEQEFEQRQLRHAEHRAEIKLSLHNLFTDPAMLEALEEEERNNTFLGRIQTLWEFLTGTRRIAVPLYRR